MLKPTFFIVALALLTGGCADPQTHADALATRGALTRDTIDTDSFVLTAYQRLTRPGLPLTVYIEGDGLAWINRNEASTDPTPLNPLGLRLAAVDPGPNVLYLARPCQFTPRRDNPRCTVDLWTSRRFSSVVVDSLDQAIDHYVRQAQSHGIELVGYSGGGALAVLLAARRHDVLSVRTVAGNLDQAEVNRLHGVSPMPESLNAIDVAHQVSGIPQWHFSGADDHTVPPQIATRFAAAAGGDCIRLKVLPGMTHGGDWPRLWPALLALAPRCGKR
jgi:pimeloyl-ACP methyl ester carboxylesterase